MMKLTLGSKLKLETGEQAIITSSVIEDDKTIYIALHTRDKGMKFGAFGYLEDGTPRGESPAITEILE